MKNKLINKIVIMATAVVMCFGMISMKAEAKMQNGWGVSVEHGVVDSITVNGVTVEALYNPSGNVSDRDTTYCCAALVKRFYNQVYGQNVWGLENVKSIPQIDRGEFSETRNPKVGDILRDNESVHWAIVKEVNGSTVTLIQQNAWFSKYTKAWVGATADMSDSRYTYFTWNGNTAESSINQATRDFTIQYHDFEITDTNAVAHAKVLNPERLAVKQVGCYVWDAAGNQLLRHEESCDRKESKFNMWYDFTDELGLTLTPGTEYSYQFYVMYDGVEYVGEKQNFTTSGTAPKEVVSDENKPLPQQQYVEDGLYLMQALVGRSEEDVWNEVGNPVKTEGNKKFYPENCNGLFGTYAPLIIEFENGYVKSITWTYTYANASYAEESESFYEKVTQSGNKVFGQNGYGICKNPGNATYTWDQKAEVKRDIIKDIPTITVKVECSYR